MDEVARHDGRDGTYWVEVQGEVYDVTAFMPRHPGGSLLELAAGRHATVLFEAYHPGASRQRAQRVLSRQATHLGSLDPEDREYYGDPAFFEAVQARVAAQLDARGLHYHSRAWALGLEAVVLVLLFTAAWFFRVFEGSYLAAVIGGVLMARMGFVMHSGNHAAFSHRSRFNAFGGALMDYIGGSSLVWKVDHQFSHHSRPNVLGQDNDAQIGAPLLRFHPGLPRRWWHRFQSPGLAIGMSIGMIKWIITDLRYALRGRVSLAPIRFSRREWARMVVFKCLWVVMNLVVPIATLGIAEALLTGFIMLAVAAYYMEGIFIVNHLQRDLVPEPRVHWAIQQVQGTANWRSGSQVANFISGGLNHQIEHHLFPGMSIYLYPVIAPVVRETCEERGPSATSTRWGGPSGRRGARPARASTPSPCSGRAATRGAGGHEGGLARSRDCVG